MATRFIKDPSARLDFRFDYAGRTNGTGAARDWLEPNETIIDHTVTAPAGIVLLASEITNNNTCVTFWIEGGAANRDYIVTCRVTTSDNRIDERSAVIQVRNR